MLLVTHNMELAQISPRVIRMADGRLAGDAAGTNAAASAARREERKRANENAGRS